MNNSRNRDAYGRSKIRGMLDFDDTVKNEAYTVEDNMIERIDAELEIIKIFEELDKK